MDKVLDIAEVQAQVAGTPTAPVPMKLVPVKITGILADGNTVQDTAELRIPQSDNDYTSAMAWLWNQYRQAGAISFQEKGGGFSIYPLNSFKKLEIEFSSVVGVTL